MNPTDQRTTHTVTVAAEEPPRRSLEAAGITPFEAAPSGVVLARLVGFEDGRPLVLLPGRPNPVVAAAACSLGSDQVGNVLAIMFLAADLAKPVVIGPLVAAPDTADVPVPAHLELRAERELVLQCGPATLRLLSDGTAILRGVNVVTRAAATNRIRGGNVQIN